MRNPFGLLFKGLALACFWWILFTGLSTVQSQPPQLAEVLPRLASWGIAVVLSGLVAWLIEINGREALQQGLEASQFWGVQVTRGRFPVLARGAGGVSDQRAVVAGLKVELEKLPEEMVALAMGLLSLPLKGKGAREREIMTFVACAKSISGDFHYTGFTLLGLPPADPSYDFDPADPLLVPLAIGLSRVIEEPRGKGLLQLMRATALLKEYRALAVEDQSAFSQVISHFDQPASLSLAKSEAGEMNLRSDRVAALLQVLLEAEKRLPQQEAAGDRGGNEREPPLQTVAPLGNAPVDVGSIGVISTAVMDPELPHQEKVTKPPQDIEGADIFVALYDLLHEPYRINGAKGELRVGLLHGKHVYLMPEALAKGLMGERFSGSKPHELINRILACLAEKGVLYQVGDKKLFQVIFRGTINEEEKTNIYNGMILFEWEKIMPLLGSRGDSLFVPEVMTDESLREVRNVKLAKKKPVCDGGLAEVAPETEAEVVVCPALEPDRNDMTRYQRELFDQLNKLAEGNSPHVARQQHESGVVWLYVALTKVESQEVPLSVFQVGTLLKHRDSVSGFQVSENAKGSTILGFSRAETGQAR